jgi:hypothetical protein
MEEILLGITLVFLIYYYFNIFEQSKCIVMNPSCLGINCITNSMIINKNYS